MPDSLFKPERIPYQAGNINGSTELLGLIGGSIKDSLSPLIHNASISYLQKNSIYLPFNFRSDNLPGLLETCKHLRIRHLNVTAPFKTKIMSYIEAAPNLPSINTLTYNDSVNNFIGHSTDGAGFCRGLSTIDRTIADYDDIIFLGYGGAAKAILAHLATLPSAGSQHITLLNKSPISKDTAIKHNKRFRKTYIGELTFQEVSSAVTLGNPSQLIVQATSGPLKGDDLRWLTPALKRLKGTFYELNYGKTSHALTQLKANGSTCLDGIPMLIAQALLSQEFWWENQQIGHTSIALSMALYRNR